MTSELSDTPRAASGRRAGIRSVATLNVTMVLVATASALGFAASALALGRTIGGGVVLFGLSTALLVPIHALLQSHEARGPVGIATASFAVVVLVAGLSATATHDTSWDGRDYQQYAIHRIATGFNPVRDTQMPLGDYRSLELNHYPKAAWYLGAAARNLTGHIEAAKALNILLAWGAACLAFLALEARPWGSLADSVLLAALVGMNPVVTSQLLTNYVDGLGASMLTMLFAVSALLLVDAGRRRFVELGLILIIGLNVKFTITATMAFLLPFLMLGVALHHRWQTTKKLIWTAVAGCLVGLVVVGYSPYVRNTLEYGNPLYPTLGSDAMVSAAEILGPQIEPGFMDRPRPARLALGLFGASMNDPDGYAALKVPFLASRSEFLQFRQPDVRIGGFGPWFGATLLLALVGFVLWGHRRDRGIVAGAALLLLASALLHDGGWWARYAPHLWLIPACGLAVPWSRRRETGGGRSSVGPAVRMVVLSLALANAVGVAASAWSGTIRDTLETHAALEDVQRLVDAGQTVLVFPSFFVGTEYLLEERGIPYALVASEADLPCPRKLTGGTAYSSSSCSAESSGAGSAQR